MVLLIQVSKIKELCYKEKVIEFISNNYDTHDSQMTIFWQFDRLSEVFKEEKITKDITEMNEEEIKDILIKLKFSTITSAINNINTYKRYIDYYNKENNPFYNFDSYSELASEVIAKDKNPRYTRQEILDMINELNNYTDQALILALFEGIKGKSFSELLTLKTSNLYEKDGKYYAKVFDSANQDYRPNDVQISEKLYELLHKADSQPTYRTNNEQEIVETPFNESEFIFKKAKKGRQGGNILDRHFITRKFIFFKQFFGNENLSADDIVRSGMMYMAYELFKESNKIGKQELLSIGEHYNTVMATSNGKDFYRNITDIKRKIFNEQLGELYPELSNIKYSEWENGNTCKSVLPLQFSEKVFQLM